MQQQINLFQPVFRREAKVFSARALAQVLVLALVLIVTSFALLQLQLGRHNTTRDLLDGQFRSLNSQLQTLEKRADAGELAALETRIKELENRLAEGAEELAGLQDQVLSRSDGYASLLEALARHPQSGLWLTAIRAQDDGLELEGLTLDPERLPAYLAELNADAALARWPLIAVKMERLADPSAQLRFVLRSAGAAEGDDG